MMISQSDWLRFANRMGEIDTRAGDLMRKWIEANGTENRDALIEYANALVQKYGEASGELACQMYEAIAEAQGITIPPAELADLPSYGEVAKAVNGSLKQGAAVVPQAVSRQVKQVGADTTLKNAERDGAQFAWIPSGDTCAFCLTIASRGWQNMSKSALKGGHAEHIHANCNCQYAIRFDRSSFVQGYDPDKYLEMYKNAEGVSSKEKINSLRRQINASEKKISSPIETRNTARGKPSAVSIFDVELSTRQIRLLEKLNGFDSQITVAKSEVNMKDLSALTAKTGDEFAMFTKGQERLIVRGNSNSVNIDVETAKKMAYNGYKWSGHTHPGTDTNCLIASPGDHAVLAVFGQDMSVIYNSLGQYLTFEVE